MKFTIHDFQFAIGRRGAPSADLAICVTPEGVAERMFGGFRDGKLSSDMRGCGFYGDC